MEDRGKDIPDSVRQLAEEYFTEAIHMLYDRYHAIAPPEARLHLTLAGTDEFYGVTFETISPHWNIPPGQAAVLGKSCETKMRDLCGSSLEGSPIPAIHAEATISGEHRIVSLEIIKS